MILTQSPVEPGFVQNPYPFYDTARAMGGLPRWEAFGMVAAFDHATVHALLRDRRFGREIPVELTQPMPAHLEPFYRIEMHSLLEAEPPRHTRLRSLVLRAFTSRRIAGLGPEIATLAHQLIDGFPKDVAFDLLSAFCTKIPVIIISRLLGVPEAMAPDLLRWSHDMVAMYQAGRTRSVEERAARASEAFATFLRDYIDARRKLPADDLITQLIAAETEGERLSTDELITTCVLLLNAGHEATVHALGNGVKCLLEHGLGAETLTPETVDGTVEEILRYDPPLHLFTRYAYETVEISGVVLERGDQVALMLGAANRDPAIWDDPNRFAPARPIVTNASFGAGVHFCVGAPLARLEMSVALPILFNRCPNLALAEPPIYADRYHFHGLERLMVSI